MQVAKSLLKKAIKGKASDDTNQKVSKILVELLASSELEHGQVIERLKKQLSYGNKTIRNSIRAIFADPVIIHNAIGKPVKLAKSYHGRKNFLALEPTDGLGQSIVVN